MLWNPVNKFKKKITTEKKPSLAWIYEPQCLSSFFSHICKTLKYPHISTGWLSWCISDQVQFVIWFWIKSNVQAYTLNASWATCYSTGWARNNKFPRNGVKFCTNPFAFSSIHEILISIHHYINFIHHTTSKFVFYTMNVDSKVIELCTFSFSPWEICLAWLSPKGDHGTVFCQCHQTATMVPKGLKQHSCRGRPPSPSSCLPAIWFTCNFGLGFSPFIFKDSSVLESLESLKDILDKLKAGHGFQYLQWFWNEYPFNLGFAGEMLVFPPCAADFSPITFLWLPFQLVSC